MGNEAASTATFKGTTAAGKARLATAVLQFRGGDLKLSIPFAAMSQVVARGGTLRVTFPGGTAAFDLGAAAPKWAEKFSERATMAAGKAAGLVDVKVVGVSPTHTAEKWVIPIAARPKVR